MKVIFEMKNRTVEFVNFELRLNLFCINIKIVSKYFFNFNF